MPRALRIVLTTLGLLAALLVLVIAASAFRVYARTSTVQSKYPPPGRFVTVAGGQRLHHTDTGQTASGKHTVVLLHGNAGSVLDFDRLVPLVATTTPEDITAVIEEVLRPFHPWPRSGTGRARV